MTLFQILLVSAGIVLGYLYLRLRLISLLQPLRLELIDRAAQLLSHGDLLDRDREFIDATLDQVYSVRAAWALALLVFPFSLGGLFKKRTKESLNRPHRGELVRFVRLAVPCILVNSPFAATILVLSVVLSNLLLLPVRSAVFLATEYASKHGHHHHQPQA